MHIMIKAEHLTKDYGAKKAVADLDLEVGLGSTFGFLGPNGAGKTTTIRILTTLTRPTSGRAWINGFDVVREATKVKGEFGIVQQHLSLNRELSVRENLDLHARLHHLDKAERKERIDELLDYVNLSEYSDHLIDRISGGMKRRVMIARALIHRPRLLILDEPTVGLDAQTRRRIWDLIRRMNSDGTTVFLTTHYIEEAEALCDDVGIIHQGRMISLGSPLDLRKRLGLAAVELRRSGNGTEYRYFPDRASATVYVQSLPSSAENIVLRESNLEDVFVELTGRRVSE
jgi:ABC-2 type transport system ATP-binding protein